LQKGHTVDFLTKKREKNNGELQKFYIEEDHEAIISPEIWECVQLEMERRKQYTTDHYLKAYSAKTENNPFLERLYAVNVIGHLAERLGQIKVYQERCGSVMEDMRLRVFKGATIVILRKVH